jgi:hypothetical protein
LSSGLTAEWGIQKSPIPIAEDNNGGYIKVKGLEAPVFTVESLLKKGRLTQHCGGATVHGRGALRHTGDSSKGNRLV